MKNLCAHKNNCLFLILLTILLNIININSSSAKLSNDALCPSPKESLENSITDLELVQEDITRLTLCVERAQLLDRLNSLVDENSETIENSFLDEIDSISNSINFQSFVTPSISQQNPIESDSEKSIISSASQWRIQSISGINNTLAATVIGSNNTIKTVKVGDQLDNNTTIKSIDASGISVLSGSQITTLEWSE